MLTALRVRSRPPRRCALCHDRLGVEPHARCACGTVLHRECLPARGCPTLGCDGARRGAQAQPVGAWLALPALLLAGALSALALGPVGEGGTTLARQLHCWRHYLGMAVLASTSAAGLLLLGRRAASWPGFALAFLGGTGLGRMALALVVSVMHGFTFFQGGKSREQLLWGEDLFTACGACLALLGALVGTCALALRADPGGRLRGLAWGGALLALVGLAVGASHLLFVLAMS